VIGSLRQFGLDAASAAVDLLIPRQCPVCGVFVQNAGLCAACWPDARFIAAPLCARCGLPFEYDVGPETWCGACHAAPPPFARARAAMVYDDVSRTLVLAFKHADRLDLTPLVVSWMQSAGGDLLADAQLIVPVPLHPRRLYRRHYNQAAILANALGVAGDIHVAVDGIKRVRHTASQSGLGRKARERNLRRAIAPSSGARAQIEGRRVLLIDDVFTTGATADACTRALMSAGAVQVDVLTFARVV
jgi:ComF family protein